MDEPLNIFDAIRDQARHGGETDYEPAKKPDAADESLPGSEDRLRVLKQRLLNGESLWHPDDQRFDFAALKQDGLRGEPHLEAELSEEDFPPYLS